MLFMISLVKINIILIYTNNYYIVNECIFVVFLVCVKYGAGTQSLFNHLSFCDVFHNFIFTMAPHQRRKIKPVYIYDELHGNLYPISGGKLLYENYYPLIIKMKDVFKDDTMGQNEIFVNQTNDISIYTAI